MNERKLKNVIDLARGGKLGIDRHGKPERLLQQNELIGVFHISHAGDRVRAAEGARRHAAENVRFIRRRHGDDQVGLVHAGVA